VCVSGIGFVSVSTILIGRKNCSDVWYFSLDVRTVLTCGIFIGRKNCSDVWYFHWT
jgi:ABC-type multidrug transport system permease subunit